MFGGTLAGDDVSQYVVACDASAVIEFPHRVLFYQLISLWAFCKNIIL